MRYFLKNVNVISTITFKVRTVYAQPIFLFWGYFAMSIWRHFPWSNSKYSRQDISSPEKGFNPIFSAFEAHVGGLRYAFYPFNNNEITIRYGFPLFA